MKWAKQVSEVHVNTATNVDVEGKTKKLTVINNLFWLEWINEEEGGSAVQGRSWGSLAPFPKVLIDSLSAIA